MDTYTKTTIESLIAELQAVLRRNYEKVSEDEYLSAGGHNALVAWFGCEPEDYTF